MKKIISILKDNPAYQVMSQGKGEIIVSNTSDEAYLIASAFSSSLKKILVVKENMYQAQLLYQELVGLLKNKVVFFSCDESLRIEALASSKELLGERIYALSKMKEDEPLVVVCHTHSFIRHLPSREVFNDYIIYLKEGMVIDPAVLRQYLIRNGYHNIQRVDEPFYFSKRGGVIDIYSIQYENPIRIEFFDDEIESIRFFDKNTQRSLDTVKEVTILPASDILYKDNEVEQVIDKIYELKASSDVEMMDQLDEEVAIDIECLRINEYSSRLYGYMELFSSTTSLHDYFKPDLMITSSLNKIKGVYKRFVEETFFYYRELRDISKMVQGLKLYRDIDLIDRRDIDFSEFRENDNQVAFITRGVEININKEADVVRQIKDYCVHNKVLICLDTRRQIELMVNLFEDHHMRYMLVGNNVDIYPGISMYLGDLKTGIEFVEEKVVVLTPLELFKAQGERKKGYIRYKDAKIIKDYTELEIGDYVVHDVHGIGQYMGIKTLDDNGTMRDYLYVAYQGNDSLYIPVENFKLIRKYSSRDGKVPKIHALGSTEWQKTKQKIRKKVDGLADKLIALYAKRMNQPGFAYSEDNVLQIQFEEDFGYDLTPDQQKAVDEIKDDMMKARPMDRLLCGDVGFGKTEVALRACFKAICDNKQVAFLCPTTILSSQHYKTMLKRFERFPVNIALLNRFTKTKEKKKILEDLKEGKIDLLVGTHRILSKDVEFKDLGLLCIDEEQRFGVKQKEKIKELREVIDVLTLTATPIPRTLQMSLMGIRGLSQIDTPPLNRLPVQTYVMEKSRHLIKQVIERELGRKGQVFYLYNKTEDIELVMKDVQSMVPDARVGFGHGQMSKEQLENVMNAFVAKEYDVLVCTTIIETGIDIPNANTIIVENADRFGLAQLYQIKGRVGRSDRLAYAYLLYNKGKQLNEDAAKRLKAIKEFAQLGSGYKIAMRDLSIRGAGDILGGEQAGFIDSVGFDMYMKILNEAIEEKSGKKEAEKEVPVQRVKVSGYIPENYVENDIEKLKIYQRIYYAKNIKEIDVLHNELKDLYGKLPREVENIVLKRRYDILCTLSFIEEIREEGDYMSLKLAKDFSSTVSGDELFALINRLFKKPQIRYIQGYITIYIPTIGNWLTLTIELMEKLNIMNKKVK